MALKIAGAVGISACSPMPLAPNGPIGGRVLDQDALDRRHVADGRNEVVVQVLALAGEELLHQRETETLRGAALDLAFDQRRIDRAADVVRACEPQDFDAAELDIDLDLGDMRARPEHRVGLALAVLVERRSRRIEGLGDLHDEARGVDRQFRQIDPPFAARARDDHRAGGEADPRLLAHVRQSQDRGAHRSRGQDRRVAGDEGLARGGGLAAIGRHVGVRRDEVQQRDRRAERFGANLRDDGVGALPDVDRALEQREPSVGLQAEPHRRRIGERGVAAAVPHAGDADAAPQRSCGGGVERSGGRERLAPARSQRLEARLETHAVGEDLAGDRGVACLQRIEDTKLEPVEAEPLGEFVEQLLLCDRGLRHAEPAEGA